MKRQKLARHNSGLSLSEDMMGEIFLWLPVKSLVRFKRLSKKWRFLISHKDSYFRRNYLSTLSTRRRNRIVGGGGSSGIMAGFFYQKPESLSSYDRVRFLPTTTTTTTTTTTSTQFNNINRPSFSSLDESLDKFLSSCLVLLHQDDQDSAGVPKKIFIAASSNGFLLLSLESRYPETYYLVNPVTMEWVPLPKVQTIESRVYVGFVCNGDYPSLDLVGYTILRISWQERNLELLFEIFCDGDNDWRECTCSCESLVPFQLSGQQNTVIVTGTTGGEAGIVVYFLVTVKKTMATAIVVFDCSRKDKSLQMIETPGPDRGSSAIECDDYIRESDDDDDGGSIHYVRICCNKDFEFWVLNTQSREWCLKHRASLATMMNEYPWRDIRLWQEGSVRQRNDAIERYHIHAFHPLNPNLIFLTLYGRMVCYNVETGALELVYDFSEPNMMEFYCHYVYQWPCWPPLI